MRQTRSGNPAFPSWKFESPRLGACLLVRERLLGRVEQCLDGTQESGDILLVSAPAGYGKTTLLTQWALRTSMPLVWYHLDHSDQDPATFLRGIAQALRRKFPRPRWNVESILNNLRSDFLSESDLGRASRVLAADIEQHVARPAALILTGVAELGTRSPGLVALDRLISRPVDHLRLALEWREAPRVRFSSLVAQQRVQAIGTEDLRLTAEELDTLLTLVGAPDDPAFREQVQRLSTGWVAGAILAVGAQTPLATPALAPGQLDHEAVVDYLAHQVIAALPTALRSFASEAAILNYMTPRLCARLLALPIGVARERLGALERSTGFVSRSGHRPQELVYRFQPLLRQALLAQLVSLPHGNTRKLALHRRSAEILAEEQDYEEAVWHYAEARSYVCIAELIESVREQYLRSSRGVVLTRWLDLLPAAVYKERPHLQLLRAELYRQSGRRSQALRLAGQARKRLTLSCQPPKTPGRLAEDPVAYRLAAHAAVITAEVLHDLASYPESQQACHEALAFLISASEAGTEISDLEGLYVRAYETLAESVLVTEGPEAAEPYLRVSERYSLYNGDLWKVGRHHYHRSKVLMRDGDFAHAESAAIAALLASQEAQDEIYAVASRLNLGAIKMRLGRAREAREELETALVAAEGAGYILGQGYALSNLADLALSCGAYLEAINLYEQMFKVMTCVEDTHLQLAGSAGLGYALALAGRPEEALIRLTPLVKATRRRQASKSPSGSADDVVVTLSLGFAYLRHGLTSYAETLFAHAAHDALDHGFVLKGAQAHLFLSALRVSEGNETEAKSELWLALGQALQIHDGVALAVELRRVPEVWSLLDQLDHPLAADLMHAARSGSREEAIGQALGQESKIAGFTPSLSVPDLGTHGAPILAGSQPDQSRQADKSIRVFMFGAARVLVGTTYVTRWKKPAARELLLFLLHHKRSASREAILTALWPDIDPMVSDVWFRQTRFHLQHTLGRECLVQEETGYWRLELDCWVDVYEAERLVDEGVRLVATGEKSAGADHLRQALTVWHGPYLDDLYVDWTAARRQELYYLRLSCLEQLADLELEAASLDKATQLYQQILATEPFYESAHRGLMKCFVARGEPSRAIQQFRAFATLLHEDLATTPAPETLALCQTILRELRTTARAFAEVVSQTSVLT